MRNLFSRALQVSTITCKVKFPLNYVRKVHFQKNYYYRNQFKKFNFFLDSEQYIICHTALKNKIKVFMHPQKQFFLRFFIMIDPLFVRHPLIFPLFNPSFQKYLVRILRRCEIPKFAIKSNSSQSLFRIGQRY